MNLAVITSGFLPVPATKGGAVENLVQNILDENELINEAIHFTVLSIYDKNAEKISQKYEKTNFVFFKIPQFVNLLDLLIFAIAKHIFRKKNCQSYRYILQRLYYLNKCSQYLKNNDFDKVLLENHPTQYLALKWRKNYIKYSGRYYYHCHNELVGLYKCRKVIEKTSNFICVSEYIAESLKKYLEIPRNRISVLRNCVDEEIFSKGVSDKEKKVLKKKFNINTNEKVLIFTGRLVPEKGVKELLKALNYVKNSNYKLLVLGKSLNDLDSKTNYEQELEAILNSNLKEKVIFTGYVDYKDIYKYYSLADFAVLPSIWNDPAPLTVIESLVSGLPIISTYSGGIPEYAIGDSAILLKRDQMLVKNLAKAIDNLINDKNRLVSMSKAAIDVSDELSKRSYYKNFYSIINNK